MATSVLTDALILLHGTDLTCQSNTVAMDYGAETQDDTTLCDDTRSNRAGLKTVGFNAEGFFDGDMDSDLFSAHGASGQIITVSDGKSQGDVSFSLISTISNYQPFAGSVGELASYTLDASARGSLERGQILFHSDSETASGTGATLNSGSAAAELVAILHVFSMDGTNPTLDVTVESDSADDFTGSEVTRATFTQATATTAERVIGTATSDTWWRVNYTIGGTNPEIAFAVILIPTTS